EGSCSGGLIRPPLFSETEKHCHALVEPRHAVGIQLADPVTDLGFRNGRNLVDHDMRADLQSVCRRWRKLKTCRGGVHRRAGEQTNRDGWCGVEFIALDNDGWARLAGIIGAAGYDPDFTPFHLSVLLRGQP